MRFLGNVLATVMEFLFPYVAIFRIVLISAIAGNSSDVVVRKFGYRTRLSEATNDYAGKLP